jgi:hypothetical protein
LRNLGWTYIPAIEAPDGLLACLDSKEAKITRDYLGSEVVILFGGLNGTVTYFGVGLTPAGKEKEAEVTRMLASAKMIEVNGVLIPDVFELLRRTADFTK